MDEIAIKEVLSSIFDEAGFELNMSKAYFSLTLHYPILTIQNNVDESHEIKDLYVKITGNLTSNSCKSLTGVRATRSYAELISNYNHSHLPSHRMSEWNYFCLGSSEIQMLLCEDIFQSEEYLRYFCVVLESYLSWESVEGNPYIGMNTINPFGRLGSCDWNVRDFNRIPLKIDKVDINLNFEVKNKDLIEDSLYQALIDSKSENLMRYNIVNRIGDTYYSTLIETDVVRYDNTNLFTFNGKQINLIIEKQDEEIKKQVKRTIHPAITQSWCNRASTSIKEYYLTSNRITQEAA